MFAELSQQGLSAWVSVPDFCRITVMLMIKVGFQNRLIKFQISLKLLFWVHVKHFDCFLQDVLQYKSINIYM